MQESLRQAALALAAIGMTACGSETRVISNTQDEPGDPRPAEPSAASETSTWVPLDPGTVTHVPVGVQVHVAYDASPPLSYRQTDTYAPTPAHLTPLAPPIELDLAGDAGGVTLVLPCEAGRYAVVLHQAPAGDVWLPTGTAQAQCRRHHGAPGRIYHRVASSGIYAVFAAARPPLACVRTESRREENGRLDQLTETLSLYDDAERVTRESRRSYRWISDDQQIKGRSLATTDYLSNVAATKTLDTNHDGTPDDSLSLTFDAYGNLIGRILTSVTPQAQLSAPSLIDKYRRPAGDWLTYSQDSDSATRAFDAHGTLRSETVMYDRYEKRHVYKWGYDALGRITEYYRKVTNAESSAVSAEERFSYRYLRSDTEPTAVRWDTNFDRRLDPMDAVAEVVHENLLSDSVTTFSYTYTAEGLPETKTTTRTQPSSVPNETLSYVVSSRDDSLVTIAEVSHPDSPSYRSFDQRRLVVMAGNPAATDATEWRHDEYGRMTRTGLLGTIEDAPREVVSWQGVGAARARQVFDYTTGTAPVVTIEERFDDADYQSFRRFRSSLIDGVDTDVRDTQCDHQVDLDAL